MGKSCLSMLSLDLPFGKLEFTKTCGVILYH